MGVKFILKIGLIILILFYAGKFLGLKLTETDSSNPVIKFRDPNGNLRIEIREPEKTRLKNFTQKIKDLVYSEATKHNPEGDMLPDQIDNRVIQEVKERIE